MKTAWFQVKFDLENQSRIRVGLAQSFIERVDKPIMEFKDKQKKSRKDVSFFLLLLFLLLLLQLPPPIVADPPSLNDSLKPPLPKTGRCL